MLIDMLRLTRGDRLDLDRGETHLPQLRGDEGHVVALELARDELPVAVADLVVERGGWHQLPSCERICSALQVVAELGRVVAAVVGDRLGDAAGLDDLGEALVHRLHADG